MDIHKILYGQLWDENFLAIVSQPRKKISSSNPRYGYKTLHRMHKSEFQVIFKITLD